MTGWKRDVWNGRVRYEVSVLVCKKGRERNGDIFGGRGTRERRGERERERGGKLQANHIQHMHTWPTKPYITKHAQRNK